MKKVDGTIDGITEKDMKLLEKRPQKFWSDVNQIGRYAFLRVTQPYSLTIPPSVTDYDDFSFNSNTKLKNIVMHSRTKTLPLGLFSGCTKLESVQLPPGLTVLPTKILFNCHSLKELTLGERVEKIEDKAVGFCRNLNILTIKNLKTHVHKNAFLGTDFNFITLTKNSVQLTKEKLKTKGKSMQLDCTGFTQNIPDFNVSHILNGLLNYKEALPLIEKLKETNTFLPSSFIHEIQRICYLPSFAEDANFKWFNQILPIKNQLSTPRVLPLFDDCSSVCKFAYALGVFSHDDKISQRATEFLREKMGRGQLPLEKIDAIFKNVELKVFDKDFANFFMNKDNFKSILHGEFLGLDSVAKIYENFEEASSKFITAHSSGIPRKLAPTPEMFLKYMSEKRFSGITDETRDVAYKLAQYTEFTQNNFENALHILNKFKEQNAPKNILGFHLKEEISNDRVREYDKKMEKYKDDAVNGMVDMLEKMSIEKRKSDPVFEYDWLEKDDLNVFVLGLDCSCCAHVEGVGKGLMAASILHNDMQNLVVKKDGRIVAKATLMLNREMGEAVFNTFSASFGATFWYTEIYDKLVEGAGAFAFAYNQQNSHNPLQKINVGLSFNTLEDVVKERTEKSDKIISGIDFSQFNAPNVEYNGNWKSAQYVIWDKSEADKEEMNKTSSNENERENMDAYDMENPTMLSEMIEREICGIASSAEMFKMSDSEMEVGSRDDR